MSHPAPDAPVGRQCPPRLPPQARYGCRPARPGAHRGHAPGSCSTGPWPRPGPGRCAQPARRRLHAPADSQSIPATRHRDTAQYTPQSAESRWRRSPGRPAPRCASLPVELPGQAGGVDQVTEQHRELAAFGLGQRRHTGGREGRHCRPGCPVGGSGSRDRVAAPATEARCGIIAGATLRTRPGQSLPARRAEQPGRRRGCLALWTPHRHVRRHCELGDGPSARRHRGVCSALGPVSVKLGADGRTDTAAINR